MSTIVGLIIVVVVAVFSSITAPLILKRSTDKMHREDRQADWARQDEVAAKAAKAAADLVSSQKKIADQAAEAAELLLQANERVARQAQETNGKLDVIHVLVNSNMTAAMQSELNAIRRELAMMREVLELNQAAGREPTPEALAAIDATQGRITELAATLKDRDDAAAAAAAAAAADPADAGR